MSTTGRLPSIAAGALLVLALTLGAGGGLTQPQLLQPLTHPGVVPDDMLTLVVGTRFVTPSKAGTSPRVQFTDARIPLAAFNDTDHCVDQRALEVAKEYFTNLGRVLAKAGHYYFVPEVEIRKAVSMCERVYGRAPKAWVDKETLIIAFGKVVPTVDAPALEASVR